MISAVGIDIGSLNSTIGAVVKGSVEILMNESSYRQTSNLVTYGTGQRLIGEFAKAKIGRNYKNTASNFTRVLDLDFGSEEFQKEKKFIPAKMKDLNGKCAYLVKYQGEDTLVSPELALASYFNGLVGILRNNQIQHKDICVSVPDYFTQGERIAVLTAGKIAGVNIIQLANQSEANVKNYSIFRKKDLKAEPRTVGFVDFGHSKTSVYFAKINNSSADIYYETNERHLGARNVDEAIYRVYREQFEEEFQCNVDENPKAKLRLIQAIQKQRFLLSANSEAPINVEYLMDDEDFSSSMTREDFEKHGGIVFDKVRELLRKAYMESGVSGHQLHSVEIIGGASRIPAIQQMIIEELKVDRVSRTLDQSDSCARGMAIIAAEKSPNFQVTQFKVKNLNNFNLKCNYLINKKEGLKELTGTLFKRGCDFPTTMSVTVPNTTQSKLDVFYEDPVPLKSQQTIFRIETEQVKPQHENFKLILRAIIDESGLIQFKNCELEENYIEEVKKPIKSEKKKSEMVDEKAESGNEGEMVDEKEEEFEIKKVKKTRVSAVDYTHLEAPKYSNQLIDTWKKQEEEMQKRDDLITSTQKARNDLESLIYTAKGNADDLWKDYILPEEKKVVIDLCTKLEAWIYDEGADVSREAYQEKISQIDDVTQNVTLRHKTHTDLKAAVDALPKRIQQFSGRLEQNVSFLNKCYNFLTFKVF